MTTDLLIIGGGPAGLSAAINAASEGLSVVLLDDGDTLGGQARESNAIENYAGFPDGITGALLMSNMVTQALRFGVLFICPCKVARIERQKSMIRIITEDYQEYEAKSVLLALGLQYRRLLANGIGPLMGKGIYYGLPPFAIPKNKPCHIAIVGGANSAGQAAVRCAQNARATVHMFVRRTVDLQMSMYLIDELKRTTNVVIYEHSEVKAVFGKKWLNTVEYVTKGHEPVMLKMDDMFIFIGAVPRTMWLSGILDLDDDYFIKTGGGVTPAVNAVRPPWHYETSMLGVFSAGDVRTYSTKRIAAAVGEGSAVVPMIHRYLASLEEASAHDPQSDKP